LVYVGTTYLYPQLLGGLLLGIGFILGGYCPGTSIVAMATGRLDALMFAVGVFLGVLGFGEAYPLFADFTNGSNMGSITLPEFFSVPYGLVMLLVVVIALAGFVGSEVVEKRIGKKLATS
ncbi:MAG: YeeE/YedE thiosulfate transporter family protein, partial [Rhodothermales bacterium]